MVDGSGTYCKQRASPVSRAFIWPAVKLCKLKEQHPNCSNESSTRVWYTHTIVIYFPWISLITSYSIFADRNPLPFTRVCIREFTLFISTTKWDFFTFFVLLHSRCWPQQKSANCCFEVVCSQAIFSKLFSSTQDCRRKKDRKNGGFNIYKPTS